MLLRLIRYAEPSPCRGVPTSNAQWGALEGGAGGGPVGGLVGRLFIDGTLFCTTLERRGVEILALWYTVSVTMSPRFKRLLPIVNSVPGRSGIRFHVGTQPKHSSGCILVPDRETETRLTQTLLQAQQRHETIYLEIIDSKQPAHILQDPLRLPLQRGRVQSGEQDGDQRIA